MDPFLPAWRLAELARAGEIGCLEVLDFYLDRVERLNPAINAVILLDADRARARARALDQTARAQGGALFGVPMTVKESFDLAGHPTTWGHVSRRDHRAGADALAVQRLEAAGAVVFGKTNVPVSLADWQSFNPVYGTSCNPWNVEHTPGGSSGGSAAALAAGLTGLELGSDIGGSIRVPAHFCGVFGHKPTWGLCPPRGHAMLPSGFVPQQGQWPDISVIGPLARSAEDLRLALGLIGVADPLEGGVALQVPQPRARKAADLRVAVWLDQPGQPVDPQARAAVLQAATFLRAAGATVTESARPEFDAAEAYRLYLKMLDAALSARLPDSAMAQRRAAKAALADDDTSADAIMIRGTDMTHRDWVMLNDVRYRVRAAWMRFFRDYDVVLCPVFPTAALAHDQSGESWERDITIDGQTIAYNDMLFWPGITCGYYLPATVAPVGLSSAGLPLGVQIAGPLWGDLTTIAVAGMLEEGLRAFVPPPGW